MALADRVRGTRSRDSGRGKGRVVGPSIVNSPFSPTLAGIFESFYNPSNEYGTPGGHSRLPLVAAKHLQNTRTVTIFNVAEGGFRDIRKGVLKCASILTISTHANQITLPSPIVPDAGYEYCAKVSLCYTQQPRKILVDGVGHLKGI